jgi:hypothetical protein
MKKISEKHKKRQQKKEAFKKQTPKLKPLKVDFRNM